MKIAIYRIIGAELPPRDVPDTRARVTDYILRNDPKAPEVTYHWIFNRIPSLRLRWLLRSMILRDDPHASIMLLPFDKSALTAFDQDQKVLQGIGINYARNRAIIDGQARCYDWVAVLDGDCMFRQEGLNTFVRACRQSVKDCLGLPMQRCIVDADGQQNNVGPLSEPQLAFSQRSTWRFDETIPFGKGDKVELLSRLGFFSASRHISLLSNQYCDVPTLVDHICLDHAAYPTESSGEVRNRLRTTALHELTFDPQAISVSPVDGISSPCTPGLPVLSFTGPVFYSANFGDDEPKRPLGMRHSGTTVLFVDRPTEPMDGWDHIICIPSTHLAKTPRLSARCVKLFAHRLFPAAAYTVWFDATHMPIVDLCELKPFIDDSPIACFTHPVRENVKQELTVCAQHGFLDYKTVECILNWFDQVGFKDDCGLYGTACVVRRNDFYAAALNDLWWWACLAWPPRDQVMLPWVLSVLGIKPGLLKGKPRADVYAVGETLRPNPYFDVTVW